MISEQLINELKNYYNKEYAEHHSRFFKTGKGEYGEGDLFYGLKVPNTRKIAKKYFKLIELDELQSLIENPYHEVRLAALMILVLKYPKASNEDQENIYNFYLKNVNYINNWDLVDLSAHYIVGPFLYNKDTHKLLELAKSNHLWSQRIAIISTFHFIRQGTYSPTTELAEYYLTHKHDLIHKAAGWMLREVGKRDINTLYAFLNKFYKNMPRTMLRYSIEKLSKEKESFT